MATNNQNIYQPALEGEAIVAVSKQAYQINSATIAAGGTLIKNGPGRVCKILVTTEVTNGAVTIYDTTNTSANSGTIIGYVPSSAAAGTIYDIQMVAQNGIVVAQNANLTAGVITISWS